ncbi:MAG: acyl-CoA dehydrogenase [Gammaproteobacteria bacterium]
MSAVQSQDNDNDNEELELLRESAASFCSREAPADRIKTLRESDTGYSDPIYQQFGELGWLAILVDEEAGGLGLDIMAFAAVAEQTGKQAMAEPLIEVGGLSATILSGLYKNSTFARTLTEQVLSAQGLVITAAENYRESGLAELPTGGIENDRLSLSGELSAVPYADSAEHLLVPVVIDDEFAIVCVPANASGLSRQSRELADGTTHSHLSLDEVLLAKENILGQGTEAQHIFAFAIETYQLANASYLLGLISECLTVTMEYLRTRVQFDQAIGSFQGLQHRAVDLFIQRELCAAVVSETLITAQKTKNLGDLRLLASRAQNRAIEAATLITREAIQMHGAIGFTYECNIGHYLNRALVIAARMGNGAWHRRRIESLAADIDAKDDSLDVSKVSNPSPDDWNSISDEDFRAIIRDWFEKQYPEEMRYPARRFRWAEIKDWYLKLSAKGWVAPAWPREHGGMGLSPSKMLIFMEEQERWGIGRAPDMGILMIGPLLIKHGTPEQQAHYLPKILAGENVWCQGYSEPNAGSDLASLKTSAVSDGDDFIVNGQKTWTTLAQDATNMFLLVRTSTEGRKQSGISFLLVDFDTPGITVRPIKNLAGDEEFCEVFFDNVRVPKQNIVGELNAGWSIAKALLSFERLFIGSPKYSQYTLQRLDEVVAETGLDQDQGFMDRCTKLRADVLDLESSFMKYAEIVRSGGTLGPDVSMLKIWASETFARLSELLIEASGNHGAELGSIQFGNTKANPLGQFYNARPATIYGGSNEIQRNIIAKHVLGLP